MLPFAFCAIKKGFAYEITELGEAVTGGKSRWPKRTGRAYSDSRQSATGKEATVAENLPPSDSITPELMSRIEESRIEGIVIEF